MMFIASHTDRVVRNVYDPERSAVWHECIRKIRRKKFGHGRRVVLLFGSQKIKLFPMTADASWVGRVRKTTGTTCPCFITPYSPQNVFVHLHGSNLAALQGPTERLGACESVQSICCCALDSSLIEIANDRAD